MRLVQWMDGNQERWSWIKDTDPDEKARFGIPAEPPSLEGLDWDAIRAEMEKALLAQKLFTWLDVEQSQVGLAAALNVMKRHLIRLYRERA